MPHAATAEDHTISPRTAEQTVARLDALAHLLDNRFTIPGTRFRFGLDPIISLIPVLGDTASAAISAYFIVQAIALRLPRSIIIRMLINIGIDWLAGLVPLIGFLPDAIYKANTRNARLLRAAVQRHAHPAPSPPPTAKSK
ncbi:MAG: DUF4112 domain-containing protein [Phycisphaerales bacterium]